MNRIDTILDIIIFIHIKQTKVFMNGNTFRIHYVSEGNNLEVVFHTDSTVRRSGYQLEWSTQEVKSCDQYHNSMESGTVQLHHMESGYSLPYNCSQTIVAPGKKDVLFNNLTLKCIFIVNYKILLNLTYFNFGTTLENVSTRYALLQIIFLML